MSEPTVEALELPYGTIVGDGATVHADGSDANPHPDVSAFEGVRVTFTPSDGNGRRVNTVIWTGIDGPTILHPQVEVGRFEDGRLVLDVPTPPQPDGMRLMATVSDDMVPNSWGWKMEWTGWPSGKGPGPVIFPLAPGATVDIAEALAGYLPEVPSVEFENLLAAAAEVLQARDEVQQISGLTGEDDAVAFLVDSDTTTTGQAVRAVAASTPAPATDPSVAALVGDAGSSTRAAIDGLPLVRRGDLPANVANFGAIGDGIADDTAAINAAIATGRPVALLPGASHRITSPISPVALYGNGATLVVDGDFDAVNIGPATEIGNLAVDASTAGYSSTAIRLDHTAGWNVLATATLENLTIIGPGSSSGIAIGADDGGVSKGVITFLRAKGISIQKWQYGIRLSATFSTSWMNGNEFDASMYDVARMIHLEGVTDSNRFTGQLQFSAATIVGIRCGGDGNRFETALWDYHAYPATVPYDFTGGSYNKVTSHVTARQTPLRGANPSNEVNFHSLEGLVLPRVRDRSQYLTRGSTMYTLGNFLGAQDDILRMAHRNYAVSSTVTPTSGALSRAFDFGPLPVGFDLVADQSCTITVDMSAAPVSAMHLAGVLFAYTAFPDTVKIETEAPGGALTTQLDVSSGIASPLWHTRGVIAGSVARLHVTFSVASAKTVRIGSIFASSGQTSQKSFLQTDGGKVWGDVEMGQHGIGPVVRSPDGSRWRLAVDNTGALAPVKLA